MSTHVGFWPIAPMTGLESMNAIAALLLLQREAQREQGIDLGFCTETFQP